MAAGSAIFYEITWNIGNKEHRRRREARSVCVWIIPLSSIGERSELPRTQGELLTRNSLKSAPGPHVHTHTAVESNSNNPRAPTACCTRSISSSCSPRLSRPTLTKHRPRFDFPLEPGFEGMITPPTLTVPHYSRYRRGHHTQALSLSDGHTDTSMQNISVR